MGTESKKRNRANERVEIGMMLVECMCVHVVLFWLSVVELVCGRERVQPAERSTDSRTRHRVDEVATGVPHATHLLRSPLGSLHVRIKWGAVNGREEVEREIRSAHQWIDQLRSTARRNWPTPHLSIGTLTRHHRDPSTCLRSASLHMPVCSDICLSDLLVSPPVPPSSGWAALPLPPLLQLQLRAIPMNSWPATHSSTDAASTGAWRH